MGSISGSYSCGNGSATGPFTMTQVAPGPYGFLARLEETVGGCALVGNIDGPRLDVP